MGSQHAAGHPAGGASPRGTGGLITMFRTTIKGLLGHKLRLGMTLLSIVIGVGFMAGTLVFTDTVAKTFDDLWSSTSKGTDAYVRSSSTVKAQGPGDDQR